MVQEALWQLLRIWRQDDELWEQGRCGSNCGCSQCSQAISDIIVLPIFGDPHGARYCPLSRHVRAVDRRAQTPGVLPRQDSPNWWNRLARGPHVGADGLAIRGRGSHESSCASWIRPGANRDGGRALSGKEAGQHSHGTSVTRGGAGRGRQPACSACPNAGRDAGRELLRGALRDNRAEEGGGIGTRGAATAGGSGPPPRQGRE
mmetsp:Transcript_46637/g.84178  ORF Transcript_46637/g.84178 Transcript_46637/m.84178 type:complete len:204 (-) Transcript_46637:2118-2729(-)